MKNFRLSILILPILLFGSDAFANEEHVAPIEAKIDSIMSQIVTDITISTIFAANNKRAGITQASIDALEAQWQLELESKNQPLINSVVNNSLGDHLRSVISESDGLIAEINVMDASGLSVGQSSFNSDIWQGEESKYQKSFLVGPGAVFIDEVEFDDSTQSYQSQANATIVDPASGKAIGAVSVGIDVDVLNK